jgi:prepilin-type N-terminal cleavage/methylation domain-containing protein
MRLLRKKGSSLIEVLIAMAILGLLVAPFLTMFLQAARANAESHVMMDASYYGTNLMEAVKYSIGENGMADAKTFLTGQGYTEHVYTADVHYDYTMTDSDFTYVVDLDNTDMDVPFFKITVKVFTDAAKTKCKANMQVLCQ